MRLLCVCVSVNNLSQREERRRETGECWKEKERVGGRGCRSLSKNVWVMVVLVCKGEIVTCVVVWVILG